MPFLPGNPSPQLDIRSALASYRGFIGWNAFTDGEGTVHPAVRVEVYLKDFQIPSRRMKTTESRTISQIEPISKADMSFAGVFFGLGDVLQTQCSGYIITPTKVIYSTTPVAGQPKPPVLGYQWDTRDVSGNVLNYGNVSYVEIISSYIAGTMNPTLGGAPQRRDPDYFITPHGHVYDKPIIAAWDPGYTVNQRKQSFSMTLYLER